MWHKNEGKASPEVPQPTAGSTLKSPATPETPVTSAVSAAATASAQAPAPRWAAPESPSAMATTPSASGTSRIASGLKIHGEISGSSDLYLDCELEGKLRLGGAHLVVGPNAKVQADIEAGGITIEGSVQGNIKSTESVHLGAGSRVQGSILTPRIGIDDGARLRGKVEMIRAGVAASVPTAAITVTTGTAGPPATRGTETEASRVIAASAKGE
jgi:cytoskeletal protein CcmA (bactofilin family)